MLKFNKENIYWFIWLILVVVWNYGYPSATPLMDVLVAIFLSIFFIILKKK